MESRTMNYAFTRTSSVKKNSKYCSMSQTNKNFTLLVGFFKTSDVTSSYIYYQIQN